MNCVALGSGQRAGLTLHAFILSNTVPMSEPIRLSKRVAELRGCSRADAERYARFSVPAVAAIPGDAGGGGWARRRLEGKARRASVKAARGRVSD